jgi:replicative DNA helicase
LEDNIIDINAERASVYLPYLSKAVVSLRSNPNIDVAETIEALIRDLQRMNPQGLEEDRFFYNANRLSDLALQVIQERMMNKGLPGFSTGIPILDDGIGGYERENIYTLMAKPGGGKTTFLLKAAWDVSETTPVIYFSPEARAKMMSRRLIAGIARVPQYLIRRGDITETQLKLLQHAARKMKTRPIYFYDLPEVGIRHMNAILERVYNETGDIPGLCIVDYLQQMEGEDSFQEITNNMKSLEMFAVRANVAVLLASQVGRASGDGSAIDSGKGSGKIEELSSVTMGLVQLEKKGEEYDDPTDQYRRWLVISKNREEGDHFRILLRFNKESGFLHQEG